MHGSSFSDSADRVLPVLPNCTLRPDMFTPSLAAPSHEVERYQRLRIFRALGSLPAHVTLVTGIGIGSGISGDGDGGLGRGIQEQAHPPGIPTSNQHAGLNIFELGYNNGQYTGDFSIASWNTTALFCANPAFREGRMGVVTSLLPGHDALLLQETHGTSGMLEAWARPRGYRAFFSPGATTGCACVGILLSGTFLQRFEEEPILEEIWKGRAIKVILRGRQGLLDICSVYSNWR